MGLLLQVSAVFILTCIHLQLVSSCSCHPDSFTVTREEDIQRTVCGQFPSQIYTALVLDVTCNCLPSQPGGEIYCQRDNGTDTVELLSRGVCTDRTDYYVSMLAECSSPLHYDTLPPLYNRTINFNNCPYTCPFNLVEGSFNDIQPCTYTIRIEEIFKGSFVVGNIFTGVSGPDVVTTCGSPGRVLSAGERYIVGLGGPCNPFAEWSTNNSLSENELSLLRQYGTSPSAFCPSTEGTTPPTVSTEGTTGTVTTEGTTGTVTTEGTTGSVTPKVTIPSTTLPESTSAPPTVPVFTVDESNAQVFAVNMLTLLLAVVCALWAV